MRRAVAYSYPCGTKLGEHAKPCGKCERILESVVAGLPAASDRILGQMLAEFPCRRYSSHPSSSLIDSCARRPGIEDADCCLPCRVRREIDRRVAANDAKKAARKVAGRG